MTLHTFAMIIVAFSLTRMAISFALYRAEMKRHPSNNPKESK